MSGAVPEDVGPFFVLDVLSGSDKRDCNALLDVFEYSLVSAYIRSFLPFSFVIKFYLTLTSLVTVDLTGYELTHTTLCLLSVVLYL